MQLPDEPKTRSSLLLRLRDPRDAQAWGDFVELYAPLVYRQARQAGLQDADAADVTQEVFRAVTRKIGQFEYDPRRGEFRGWLYRVTQNKLLDASERRRGVGRGDTAVYDVLDKQQAADVPDAWDHEFRQGLLTWAYDQLRAHYAPATWEAFWLTAVEGLSGEAVAARLGLSVGAVYVAKSRMLMRLKEILQPWEDEL